MKFAGKVAFITGAASGIGKAIATLLASQGATVAIADINLENAQKTAEEISAQGGKAVAVLTDVTSSASVKAAVADVLAKEGQIDILINNAGWDRVVPFINSDEDLWDKVIAINFKGTLNCAKAVIDHMVERGCGKIVNIASEAGRAGSSGEAVYSGTKGGVIAFTKALARELSRNNINVNCVAPGLVDTPLLDSINAEHPKLMGAVLKAIPLGRLGQPEDIAKAVVFMASDDADYITGQTLSVGGGLTMI
ncbi:MAG: SDR family oxidoreductase [Clostridia bacterium]|nr:SDR family oxidoreductase [Clostridia bacterium]